MLRIHDSALKHGCTREDISHAFDMALYANTIDEHTDPPKRLIIGHDGAGNLLELVGGQLNKEFWIWHAMPCRRTYRDLLPQQGGDA